MILLDDVGHLAAILHVTVKSGQEDNFDSAESFLGALELVHSPCPCRILQLASVVASPFILFQGTLEKRVFYPYVNYK
jgi:hypothetical protein